jgi:hypothetical protein
MGDSSGSLLSIAAENVKIPDFNNITFWEKVLKERFELS